MDTDAVAVLVDAALAGSLAGAARRLQISPMVATRRLAALEKDLGVRLFHRTTRSMSLTPEGEAFLPYAQALVEGELAARANLRAAREGVSGTLRVNTSTAFGRKLIAPIVPRLLKTHPSLRIDLELTDDVVDITGTGMDLAIRFTEPRENSLVARPIGISPRVLVAAPSYIEAFGRPRTAADLKHHACLSLSAMNRWPLRIDGRERQVALNVRLTATADALHDACVHGAGITLLSHWNVRENLRDGTLVRLELDDASAGDHTIWVVYPSAKLVLPKVRMFIAELESILGVEYAGRR
ncbi:LysR family transcriptional regulator [Tardiphaga sp. 1201_B9_N1_1]|jgi:DNA-binding transcriptional LysR family regulator|uniref:LysR family transcriptional regulator n=1 Tax=Tardiphaga TaxID=1395974 RepID=UPI000E766A9F|nr:MULTISPECIES: LysR family transcriptional regulator [Tardiphaga]MDR6661586.1 DNA-binding transcriptional LysR family regulator [Tardiphaga robiniae]NUU43362.1 LysR family transcriptional regulator [Tardiphaga robiniae]UFS73760.1 LysR family transcriptional regulator [Tardiphaga sp. 37S4]